MDFTVLLLLGPLHATVNNTLADVTRLLIGQPEEKFLIHP
jgi:hypothetical protein